MQGGQGGVLQSKRDTTVHGPEGHTCPEWERLTNSDDAYAFGTEGLFKGPSKWPVEGLHFPCPVAWPDMCRGQARLNGLGVMRRVLRSGRGLDGPGYSSTDSSGLKKDGHSGQEYLRGGVWEIETFLEQLASHGLLATALDDLWYVTHMMGSGHIGWTLSRHGAMSHGVTSWQCELPDLIWKVPSSEADRTSCIPWSTSTKHTACRELSVVPEQHYKPPSLDKQAWNLVQWHGLFHHGRVLACGHGGSSSLRF
ncbi:hypothetical protein CYMTET_23965 [Cymbomonas tetramitiformis]|uniref:Uncharacterized protein n=1 Tax=Cymbomonas tetramitiformis TaxID=36881 RepID=A0AAE0FXB3_9CHLO|nr:hypothetical protein CYMTET_23965 [Cymbomonas tetramitiformis]